MSEKNAPELKFPGSWEWMAVVCEGSNATFARVARKGSVIEISGIWNESFTSPKPSPADVLTRCKNLLGTSLSKKIKISVVLDEADYDTISLDEPGIKDLTDAQKQEALRWAIAPLVEFPVDRASIDVLITAGSGRRQLTAAVASEAVVAPWVIGASEMKVNVQALDVQEAAQRNLAHLFEEENKALCFLVIHESRAKLTITASGCLLMTRHIDVGSLAEITESSALRDRIGLEVQRTLDNFERQSGRAGGTHVLVAPGDRSDIITDHLKNELGLSIRSLTAEHLQSAFLVRPGISVDVSNWSHLQLLAIGAACRGSQP